MCDRAWQIGICGTFDVANYGDLLFPLIAQAELGERLGDVTLHRFSYHAKSQLDWPYEVISVTELPRMIGRLDCLLIGGGFLIRFDKHVAPGYFPPSPNIHHPAGYWLTPALIALQNRVPVIWNAPGMDCKSVPAWANPLVKTALEQSSYVAVRDEHSRATLQPLTDSSITIVPDTAFGLPRLLPGFGPSQEFEEICESSGLGGSYIVFQANRSMAECVPFLRKHAERLSHLKVLALPIGPLHGDDQELISSILPGCIRLDRWPGPLLLAELIGRSQAVFAQSYHLCISALVQGVPVFARRDLPMCKYSALQQFETLYEVPGDHDIDWFLDRVGKAIPSQAAHAKYELLRAHWDRVADVVRQGSVHGKPSLNEYWQAVPDLLEKAAARQDELTTDLAARSAALEELQSGLASTQDDLPGQLKGRTEELLGELTTARSQIASRDADLAALTNSRYWQMTSPLRFLGRLTQKHIGRCMNLNRIRFHGMETDPYLWAAIPNLFTPDDASQLADTFPLDHFKLQAKHGGERSWEYETRSLIAMGANVPSFPNELSDLWRALVVDLLSPAYRNSMTTLTGCDLANAPMEANAFHYGPGNSLSPHQDLPDKLVTHVLYFNRSWNGKDGGCLRILGSPDSDDLVAQILPVVGNSSVIVRSDKSWHAVSRVAADAPISRRAVTVTFYRSGALSTMWPPGDETPLHYYGARKSGT